MRAWPRCWPNTSKAMVSKSSTLPNPMRGLSLLKTARFDAVVVDVMLPEIEGFEKVSPIRAKSDIPILMLKARGAELQPFGRSTKVGPFLRARRGVNRMPDTDSVGAWLSLAQAGDYTLRDIIRSSRRTL